MATIERIRVQHDGGGVSLTKQSDAAATDVNDIMARWITHGVAPIDGRTPSYGDFSTMSDYHTMLERVRGAQSDFADLPASVRRRCENDPGKFLELVFNAQDRAELEELGLVPERAPAGAPDPAPVPAEEPPVEE